MTMHLYMIHGQWWKGCDEHGKLYVPIYELFSNKPPYSCSCRITHQFSCAKFFQELNCKQLANHGPCFTCSTISRVHLDLLVELETIGHQSVECGSREMRCSNLLLDGLHEELRDLRRPQLVPRKSGFTSWGNKQANRMRKVVDRK